METGVLAGDAQGDCENGDVDYRAMHPNVPLGD